MTRPSSPAPPGGASSQRVSLRSRGGGVGAPPYDDRTPRLLDVTGADRDVTLTGHAALVSRLPIRSVCVTRFYVVT